MTSETVPCKVCNQPMPKERLELLGVQTCKRCTPEELPPIGAYDYPPEFHTDGGSGVGGLIVIRGRKPGRTSI